MKKCEKEGTKAKVLIVDDHPIVRRDFETLINSQPDLIVCGSVPTGEMAMESICQLKPDLVVTNMVMPGMGGISFVKKAHDQWPELPILVCSMHDEGLFAERALSVGAKGYLMKHEAVQKLPGALRAIRAGQTYLSEKMAERMSNGGALE